MEEFQIEAAKFFDVVDIDQLITDSIHSNKPYVSLDLTSMFNTSKQMFTSLTTDYVLYHTHLRNILQNRIHSLNFKQVLEPAYYNNIVHLGLKDLKCDRLNKLTTFKATVTRTTSVRPELSIGCFQCQDCYSYTTVLQKNRYTQPLVCSNPLCKNRLKFKLDLERSLFNDWQKVFCQESYLEAENGAIPRTMVLYARNYCCEMLNPGDCLSVTGTLTVVEGEEGFELVFMVNFVETDDTVTEKFQRMLHVSQKGTDNIKGQSKLSAAVSKKISTHLDSKKEVFLSKETDRIENINTENKIQSEPYNKSEATDLFNAGVITQKGVDSSTMQDLEKIATANTENKIHNRPFNESGATDLFNAGVITQKAVDSSTMQDLEKINGFEEFSTQNPRIEETGNTLPIQSNGDIDGVCTKQSERETPQMLPELKIINSESYGSLLGIDQFILYMRSIPNLYTELAESLFPYIHGHTLIKHSILLMLAQGTRKKSKNMSIRGDINILLVGDPGTAKSQFLEETSKILPRSVYTSGKSASAAGLTACVIKDLEGEFTIEAGALMLSDKSVCCIDEFDKMDRTDRVSIHEAMEQGTITINKAGINATLNARCSVLAAANPIHGRYDESKTLRQNINLTDAIMSRFDLYFVVVDVVDEENDDRIADRVIDYHSDESNQSIMDSSLFNSPNLNRNFLEDTNSCPNPNVSVFDSQNLDLVESQSLKNTTPPLTQNKNNYSEIRTKKPKFTAEEIREYLLYIRNNVHPKLTHESKQAIVEKYLKLRQDSISNPTNYRVTVRQLESLIRLSEALAKIHCDEYVVPTYVDEAYRLLKGSVIEIKNEDVSIYNENINNSVSIERKEYMRMMNSIVYLLKTKDCLSSDELVNEYLLLREDKIESVEQFNHEETLAKVVLSHLIHREGVLYELDNKVHIHPNYDA